MRYVPPSRYLEIPEVITTRPLGAALVAPIGGDILRKQDERYYRSFPIYGNFLGFLKADMRLQLEYSLREPGGFRQSAQKSATSLAPLSPMVSSEEPPPQSILSSEAR